MLKYICGARKAGALFRFQNRGFSLPYVAQAIDVAERVLEGHAVGKQTNVFLELLQGVFGMRTKITIDIAAAKAQGVQSLLQGDDVGAMEVGETQVKCAVAQFIRGIYQCAPTNDVDIAQGIEARGDAKRRHGARGRISVELLRAFLVVDGKAQANQARLNIFDCGSLHALCNRIQENPFHMQYGAGRLRTVCVQSYPSVYQVNELRAESHDICSMRTRTKP